MSESAYQSSANDFDAFFEAVYQELLRIARAKGLNRITPTLNSTALIAEVYLKLREATQKEWREIEHVKAVAALVMVQVLRTYLRKKTARKRGQGIAPLSIQQDPLAENVSSDANVELEILQRLDLLDALKTEAPRKIRIAAMRLCGYEVPEVADALGVSEATVKRDLAGLREVLSLYISLDRSDKKRP